MIESEITCNQSSSGSHKRQKPWGMKLCCAKRPVRNEVMASSHLGKERDSGSAGRCGQRRHNRDADRFRDILHAKAVQHVRAMDLDGADADAEIVGNQFVRAADRYCLENLPLARTEQGNLLDGALGVMIRGGDL